MMKIEKKPFDIYEVRRQFRLPMYDAVYRRDHRWVLCFGESRLSCGSGNRQTENVFRIIPFANDNDYYSLAPECYQTLRNFQENMNYLPRRDNENFLETIDG